MSTSPFKIASEAEAAGRQVTDYEGALCIFTFKGTKDVETKQYGVKPAVVVDVDCVQGVAAGTQSKMPPTAFGAQPNVLEDLSGDTATDVLIFQGFLRGSFRGRREGEMVLGRIAVEGKVTSVSANDKDLKASWVLLDPTEADVQQAMAYLDRKQRAKLSAPSAAAPAAAPAAAAAPAGSFAGQAQDDTPPF